MTAWLFSSERAAKDFGCAPEYTLRAGLQDILG